MLYWFVDLLPVVRDFSKFLEAALAYRYRSKVPLPRRRAEP
jgi:hypothetical protein